MSETTVMDQLDEKIREFAATVLEREGVVTGWVLCASSTYFDDDGDECFAIDYSCGPGTSPALGRGLIESARDRMVRDLTHVCCDTEDDD